MRISLVALFICWSCAVLKAENVTIEYNPLLLRVTVRGVNDDIIKLNEYLDAGNYNSDNGFESALYINVNRFCSMTRVPVNFLEKLKTVEQIDFQFCLVESVDADDFRNNEYLKVLNLYGNDLTELTAFLFKRTPRIEEVNFSNNLISKIHPNTFADGVENLKKIFLKSNQIISLDENIFANTKMLTELDLSYNQLLRFEPKVQHLTHLEYLWLRNNEISQIGCEIFPNAETNELLIDVSANKLNELYLACGYKYNGSSRIKLWVNTNRIKEITFDASKLTCDLTSIWSIDNKIEKISFETTETLWKHNISDVSKLILLRKQMSVTLSNIDIQDVESLTTLDSLKLIDYLRQQYLNRDTFRDIFFLEKLAEPSWEVLNEPECENLNKFSERVAKDKFKLKVDDDLDEADQEFNMDDITEKSCFRREIGYFSFKRPEFVED